MKRLRHLVELHKSRANPSDDSREVLRERGDTLIEVMCSLIVLGLAAVALVLAFSTSISASAEHRRLATANIVLGSVSQQAISQIESYSNLFSCLYTNLSPAPTATQYIAENVTLNVPANYGSYSASISNVQYWQSSTASFGNTCQKGVPEEITVAVTGDGQTIYNSFVVTLPAGSSSGVSNTSNGVAAQLEFYGTQGESATGQPGVSFSPQPVVSVLDNSDQLVATDFSPVQLSIESGPTGYASATITGCTVNDPNGQAQFSGCAITGNAGTYVVQAVVVGLSSLSSDPQGHGLNENSYHPLGDSFWASSPNWYTTTFSVTIGGSPDYLKFATAPSGGASGAALATEPVIDVVKSSNGQIDTSATGPVTLSTSGGTLAGCTGLTAVKGVISVKTCTFAGAIYYNSQATPASAVATVYTLTATYSGAVPATEPLSVSEPGATAQIVFSSQPGGASSTSASTPFTPQPAVEIEDAYGNPEYNLTSANVTLAFYKTYTPSETLSGCSGNLGSFTGIVTFTGCMGSNYGTNLQIVGTYGTFSTGPSSPFSISGTPTSMVFTQEPVAGASGAALSTEPIITLYDANNYVVTGWSSAISLNASAGGTLSNCTGLVPSQGVVTVNTCAFTGTVGSSYTLTASLVISLGHTISVTSTPISPTSSGTPTTLEYSTLPVAGPAGTLLTTQPVVKIVDNAGNVVTGSSAAITLSASGGTLSGCSNLTALTGVVSVANCSFGGTVGTPYVLTASSPGLVSAMATISPSAAGSPSQLVLVQSNCPSTPAWPSLAWNASCTATATVEDAYNNPELGVSAPITFSQIGGTGAVSGLNTSNAVQGVASDVFTGSGLGTVLLDATGDGFTSNSLSFTVVGATQTAAFYSSSAYTTVITNGSTTYSPTGTYQLYAEGSGGGAITYASTTTSVCTVNATTGLVNVVGAGTCSLNATAGAIGNYNASAPVTFTLNIAKAGQTITFTNPGTLTFDQGPYTLNATASSGLAVTYTSTTTSVCTVNATSGVVTFVKTGSCSITAAQAGNANWNAATSVSQTFTINKGAQTITFANPGSESFNQSPLSLNATASSGLAVTYTSTTTPVCTVNATSGVVTFVTTGTCSITAAQAGNANWNAATSVSQSFTITVGSQTITFPNPGTQTIDSTPTVNLTATASSGLTVSYTSNSTSICTVAGTTVTLVASGTCSITAAQAGNANWNAATSVTDTFTVNKGTQTITFLNPGSQTFNTGSITLNATASSGLAVTYASNSTSICTVNATTGVVTFVTTGSCSITASQGGNTAWNAAANVTDAFTINKGTQTINFPNPGAQTYGEGTFTVSATASSGLAVTYTSTTGTVCSVNATSGVVTIETGGVCSIQAAQAGNGLWAAAANVTDNITINTAAQTITFPNPGAQTIDSTPTATLTATASSGLAVTYTSNSTSICTVAGSTVTLVSSGTCSITAAQGGNVDWSAATSVTDTFTVNKGTQTITFPNPGAQTIDSTPTATLTATASSGLAVTYTSNSTSICTVAGSTVTLVSSGTCSITAAQGGNGAWNAATSVTDTFTVNKGTQTITFPNPGTQTFDQSGNLTLGATASSGLAVTYTSTTGTVCSVNATSGVVTFVALGTCTIDANQSGNGAWNAATQVADSFTINKGTQTITFPNPGTQTFDQSGNLTLGATASSGLAVTYTSTTGTVCSVSGSTVTFLKTGATCSITAAQPGNGLWNAAAQVADSFTINKGTQTITFPNPGTQTYDEGSFSASATASSGLPVAYSSTTMSVCTVNATSGAVTIVAAGTCTLSAAQSGNANWNAATTVTDSLTIGKGDQTITFPNPGAQTLDAGAITVGASASSNQPVTYSSNNTSVCTVNPNNGVVTLVTVGTCSITAAQAGDANWNAATSVTDTFMINKGNQTITFPNPGTQVFDATPTVTLTATASSGLPVAYSSTTMSVCTVNATSGVVTFVKTGTCSITAAQAGNTNWNAATSVSDSFTINIGAALLGNGTGTTGAATGALTVPNSESVLVLVSYYGTSSITCATPTGTSLNTYVSLGAANVRTVTGGTAYQVCAYSAEGTGTNAAVTAKFSANPTLSSIEVVGILGDNAATFSLTKATANGGSSTAPTFALSGTPGATASEILFGGATNAVKAQPTWGAAPTNFTQIDSIGTGNTTESFNSAVYFGNPAATSETGNLTSPAYWGTLGIAVNP